jgi:hypothetical protein
MSSASASKVSHNLKPRAPSLTLWPQSLFGRLIAASVLAVLLAQATGLVLIVQERERFVLQSSVREWTRRIADTVLMIEPMGAAERAAELEELSAVEQPVRGPPRGGMHGPPRGPLAGRAIVRLPLTCDSVLAIIYPLRAALGPR